MIRFNYVWFREHRRGIEESKDRPAAIVLTHQTATSGAMAIVVVPITHRAPGPGDVAIKIPRNVQRRLGLDEQPAWIICDEANQALWPGFDVRPVPGRRPLTWEYGMLGPALFSEVRTRFVAVAKAGRLRTVPRN